MELKVASTMNAPIGLIRLYIADERILDNA